MPQAAPGGRRAAAKLPATVRVFVRGWLSSNNVLLLDDGGSASLIDSGYVKHAGETVALLRENLGGRRLTRLLNTHVHSDHIGGNAAVQAAFGCRIAVPAGHAKPIHDWDEDALLLEPLSQRADPFKADGVLEVGETIVAGEMSWVMIPVPGHDMDALAFYCADRRLLIPGDALWENGFGVVFPELIGRSGGFAAVRETLATLGRLSVDWVIPGHGEPFCDIDGALARAESRLAALESSPERFARNALKVILSFALMDRGRIAKADLAEFFATSRICTQISRSHLGRDPESLGPELAGELAASGALSDDGAFWVAA